MSSKEKRKYPKRHSTEIPVEFLDKSHAKGTLVNLSRDGMLVISKKLKPLFSFVRLTVFLPGVEKGVAINGKVVRHTTVNQNQGMGIQFLELDAAHRDIWLNFLSSFTQNAQAMLKDMMHIDERSINISPFQGQESTFIVRFKSLKRLEEFFPQDPKNEDFFIRTNIKKEKGDLVTIKLIHPENQQELKLKVIVQRYGKHPVKVHKEGIFFKISGYTPKLEEKIQEFLRIEVFDQ